MGSRPGSSLTVPTGGASLRTEACIVALAFVAVLPACGGREKGHAKPASISSTLPSTTTSAPLTSYQVKRGDTLAVIAPRFGVSVSAILAANHLASPDRITEGQVLQIPPPPPVTLTVSPAHAPAGEKFQLSLTGAKPSETITFEIDSPGGKKYTGPSHTASTEGTVSADYQTSVGDPVGTHDVLAKGGQGTSAHASFTVDPTTTTGP